MTKISPQATAAWIALIGASRDLTERVERKLKAAGLPSLGWYDPLWEIEKAGADGIRPFEIKDRLLLPQYSTSRLLDRLESAGLIRRDACEEDGRGQTIFLTDAGRDMRRRMWPVYADFLSTAIERTMPPEQLQMLADLLTCLRGKT